MKEMQRANVFNQCESLRYENIIKVLLMLKLRECIMFSTLIIKLYKYMESIILIILAIVVGFVLFRPISQKELERYNDKDNWSNMGF